MAGLDYCWLVFAQFPSVTRLTQGGPIAYHIPSCAVPDVTRFDV